MLTKETLDELFLVDPSIGTLQYKEICNKWFKHCSNPDAIMKTYNTNNLGRLIDNTSRKSEKGYILVKIFKREYRLHNLIWLHVHGELLPKDGYIIDHIDQNSANNSIENLRRVTINENNKNKSMNSRNNTGYNGVSFYKSPNTNEVIGYVSSVPINGKLKRKYFNFDKCGGHEKAFEMAIQFRKKMNNELGFHENHGSPKT